MKCNCQQDICKICYPPFIVTFANTTEECNCFKDFSFVLNWNGYEYVGNFTINNTKYTFILNSFDNLWSLLVSGTDDSSFFQLKTKPESHTPFLLFFKDIQQVDFCKGNFEIYITL